MLHGNKDFKVIELADATEFVQFDGITVQLEKLEDKLMKRYYNSFADYDYDDIDQWLMHNPDELYDAFYALDEAEWISMRKLFPFGIKKDSGWMTVYGELFCYIGKYFAEYSVVYDELELIWESITHHHVDDDGGFEFEAWCNDNPDIVLSVLSRQYDALMEAA